MNQPGKNKNLNKKENMPEKDTHKKHAGLHSEDNNFENDQDEQRVSPEALAVIEEITELFGKEDIVAAVRKFKADSEEKKIAVEFTNSHIQFINQVVESDYKKGIARTDVEIRDMLSHVNAMLRQKDEYLFTNMIMHCPSHYRNIQNKYYAKIKKNGNGK